MITITLGDAPDTILYLIAGQHPVADNRIIRLESRRIATAFPGWWSTQQPGCPHYYLNLTEIPFTMPLGGHFIPSPHPLGHSQLEAIVQLLRVLHNPEVEGIKGLDVEHIWAAATVHASLNISGVLLDWLYRCMATFVNMNGALGDMNMRILPPKFINGLEASRMFGWADHYRALAARVALLCGVFKDNQTGEVKLKCPGEDGGEFTVAMLGDKTFGQLHYPLGNPHAPVSC